MALENCHVVFNAKAFLKHRSGKPDVFNAEGKSLAQSGGRGERITEHTKVRKALTLTSGHANVIKHLDPVLELLSAGKLDPAPLVTHHMTLDEAPDAYRVYDNREALKIVLAP